VIIYPPEFKDSFPDRIFTVVYIEPLSTRKVPVEVETQGQMEDPTLALEDTVADPSVVSVSGPASAVADVSKVRVYLDLRLISLTQRDAQLLSVEPVTERGVVPPGVSADPKVVRVTPLISSSPQQKQVGIVAQLTGSPPQGYIMAGYEVKPPLVSLRGSSRALAAITQLATESIDLSKLTHNLDVAVDLRVPQGVAIVGSKRVQVRVMVNRVSSNAP
jgi:YbbR domain-containing protein